LAVPVDSSAARAVVAPKPPEIPPPHRFPLVATVAPLVVSAVLFAVTRSAYTLVFAALGPVVALASSVDAALSRRRLRRREAARFARDVARVSAEIEDAHRLERAERDAPSPRSAELTLFPELVGTRWRRRAIGDVPVRVGSAVLASELDYDSAPTYGSGEHDSAVDVTLIELRERSSRLDRAPVLLRVSRGVGIIGPATHRVAIARAIVLQLAASLSPAEWSVSAPAGTATEWIRLLPQAVDADRPSNGVEFRSGARSIVVICARSASELPHEIDCVVEAQANGIGLIDRATVFPDFVGEELASERASELAEFARRSGVRPSAGTLIPESLTFDSLTQVGEIDGTLVSAVGTAESGPLLLDLVADGPHAIVGGTTGSGKSELLLSWVLGMAAQRSPSAVTFLFVDFKGGASFGSLIELPHSVGVLTDLDAEQSLRAIASLAAELRHRERQLAARALRSIDDAESLPFPRLVVVVDEYAALVDTFPALHAAFADIAARGRSLGVHLVLCTQRPAGVVRDGILANCALRLSLRVTSAADSAAVLGTDAAASLPARPLGRALVSAGGGPALRFQVARSDRADVARVIDRWASAPRPRASWLSPLPHRLSFAALEPGEPADRLPFALADLPEEQAQRTAAYTPRDHGSLLVVGAGGSGKTGVLAALAMAPSTLSVIRVSTEPARLWDVLTTALSAPIDGGRVLLFDDIDIALAGCEESYQAAIVDLLSRLLREGPRAGIFCVLTARRQGGALHGLAALCDSRLVLRMSDRADHALAGGDGDFVANLPPGGGHWRGDRIQVVVAPDPVAPQGGPLSSEVIAATADFVVASSRPDAFAQRLSTLVPERSVVVLAPAAFGVPSTDLDVSNAGVPPIVVADPDVWQSQWNLFAAALRGGDVLFDGCSLADFRALTRSRDLPPPFPRGERPLWIRSADGAVRRARLASG
jgi:DNA segregation ATPase FtsK/SpoIIIE, S-DNA-T family